MKLDVVKVMYPGPSPKREREAVAGGERRVSSMFIQRAQASRREHHPTSEHSEHLPILRGANSYATSLRHHEIQGFRPRQEGYTLFGAHRTGEGVLDLIPRRVGVVHDARHGMGALKGEMQTLKPVRVTVEGNVEALNQKPPHERRSLPGDQLRSSPASRSRREDVPNEQARRIVGAGVDYAALRVARVRLLGIEELSKKNDLRPLAGRCERRATPGDTAPDHHHVRP
jgi:hypothetical protein